MRARLDVVFRMHVMYNFSKWIVIVCYWILLERMKGQRVRFERNKGMLEIICGSVYCILEFAVDPIISSCIGEAITHNSHY